MAGSSQTRGRRDQRDGLPRSRARPTISLLANRGIQPINVDLTFETLSSRPRRQILALISADGMTTSELAERFGLSAPTISRHLTLLEQAGLVSGERQGQRVVYRLNADNLVNTLTGFAFEICPIGGPLKRESRARAAAKNSTSTKKATP